MKKAARATLDAYYRDGESWGRDRHDALRLSRRIAWIVAGTAASIAVFEAAALMLLAPLKTVVPYTLLVDRNTGFVQALNPLDSQRLSGDTALTQSFLVQYVVARESFDTDSLQANYRRVSLWSVDPARAAYIAGVQFSTPSSPLARYPRSTTIETRIKSVSPLGAQVALVRFDTVRRDAGGQVFPPRAWASVIRYRYSGEPMRMEDRFINPLGFQVVRYRRDEEAFVPEPEPSPILRGQLPQTQMTPSASTFVAPAAPAARPSPTPEVEL